MKSEDPATLKKILERLMFLDPPVKKFPVIPPDPAMAVYFLDLKDVCYITTRADLGREETMFATGDGGKFFSNFRLNEIEKKLAEHPHFMRTSKFHIINLTRIRALRMSSARDLWFDGLAEPVINAVTDSLLKAFEERLTGTAASRSRITTKRPA